MTLYNSKQHHSLALLYGGFDPGLHSRYHAAFALWVLGYPDQALEKRHDALTLAGKLSHPQSWASTAAHMAMFHSLRREWKAVQELVEKGISLSNEHGFPLWGAWVTIHWGWALAEQGQMKEGIVQMRNGLTAWQVTGTEIIQPYFLGLLAEVYQKGGEAEEGLRVIDNALSVAQKNKETFCEAELRRIKGELLLQQSSDNATEAESCFQQAITIAQNQSAKSWELRAATSLARLWRSQGKRDEAVELLEPVYSWFTEGFDTADLIDAKVVLDELA
jgi:predicted ATPase